MTARSEYWQHAQECARWAAEAKNEKDREAFLHIGEVWTQLALQERAPLPERLTRSDGGNGAAPPSHS